MKKILLIIAIVGSLFSCNDNLLEKYPTDEISPNDYFANSNDLKLYANRFYGLFPVHSGWSLGTFGIDNNSDNLVPETPNNRLAGLVTLPSSGGGWSWGNIRQCNYFFDNLGKFPLDEQAKSYVAEVKFFRAMIYFDKVKTFGDIPYFTKALDNTSEELYFPRTSRTTVVDSIIADLDYAIANLKWKENAENMRLNKELAYAFKSRVCLYEGTWEKYHAGTDYGVSGSDGLRFLALAASTAEELMGKNKASIHNTSNPDKDYASLFNVTDLSSVSEALFWKQYNLELGVTHNMARYIPENGGGTGVSKSLIDDYLCIDGYPIEGNSLFVGFGKYAMLDSNRDPRLSQTVINTGDLKIITADNKKVFHTWPALDLTGENKCVTGFQIYKGANPDNKQRYGGNVGTIASIIFRYAEVLLNFAEAKAELGTLTQADIDKSIKLLRDRAGMPNMDLAAIQAHTYTKKSFPSLSNIINEIRRERRIELALEGRRFDDLMRWRAHHLIVNQRPRGFKYVGSDLEGKIVDSDGNDVITVGTAIFVDAEGYIDPYKKSLSTGYKFRPDQDYLSPIPTEELVLNPKLKPNNPGWDN
jgi:hypothetical protein